MLIVVYFFSFMYKILSNVKMLPKRLTHFTTKAIVTQNTFGIHQFPAKVVVLVNSLVQNNIQEMKFVRDSLFVPNIFLMSKYFL